MKDSYIKAIKVSQRELKANKQLKGDLQKRLSFLYIDSYIYIYIQKITNEPPEELRHVQIINIEKRRNLK